MKNIISPFPWQKMASLLQNTDSFLLKIYIKVLLKVVTNVLSFTPVQEYSHTQSATDHLECLKPLFSVNINQALMALT